MQTASSGLTERRGRALASTCLASALALAAGSGCAARERATAAPSARAPVAASALAGGGPSWLPPYSAEQLALLAPPARAVQVRAARVFPDLGRFGYANNRRLANVHDALEFTKLVATVLEESPRLYVLGEANAALANTIAQYGPPPAAEPDPWRVTRRDAAGIGTLVPAENMAAGRADYDRGEAARKKGDLAGAAAGYRAAAQKAPTVPVYHLALGDVLAASKDATGAKAAYEAAIAADPTLATGHTALAELASRSGDNALARHAVAEALAWYPASARALAVADLLTSGGASAGTGRIRPFSVFIDVDAAGAIHADADPSGKNPAEMYASCRAVMRYEPDLRAAVFEQPPETPYFLTVAEEVICLESALGAYAVDQTTGDEQRERPPPDPRVEALLELARKEGLSGYVMVEILGPHRPERARTAPPDVHRAMVDYVDRFVLGGAGSDSSPQGVLTASR
jgi:tetratricopeptide (TPR) repeat protein